jgi:hypothetical protein
MAKIAASLFRGYRRRSRDAAPFLAVEFLSLLGGALPDRIARCISEGDWKSVLESNIDPRT